VFPGGYVDRGEEVQTAAIREAAKKRLDVRIDRLINVYSYHGRTPVIIVYAATMIGGVWDATMRARSEVLRAERDPWDDLAFRSTQEALREFFRRP
jgi:ADP-ribose pyrophosphatase YjhB (NUDIX family)